MSEIQPALTPEEWAATEEIKAKMIDRLGSAHALAALALYGQPFGFTLDDLRELDFLIEAIVREWQEGDESAFLRSIKSRIEALLPPVK